MKREAGVTKQLFEVRRLAARVKTWRWCDGVRVRRALHRTRRRLGRSCVIKRMILIRKGALSKAVMTRHTFVSRHTSHVTRHTSHVTRHTSHVTRHTSHAILFARNSKRLGLELVDNLPVLGLIKVGDLVASQPHVHIHLLNLSQAGVHGALGQHRRARTAAIRSHFTDN